MRKSVLLVWTICTLGISILSAQDFQLSQLDLHLQLHHPTAAVLQPNVQQLRLAYRSERLPDANLRNLFLSYNHSINDFTFGLSAGQSTAGIASLENMRIALQANYQRILNDNEDALTGGIRVGILQRRFRGGDFQFDRQYITGQGWDAGLESGESISKGSITVPVIDAGLLFRKYFDRFETNFGVSLNTINQPEMKLVDGMAMSYPTQLSLFSRISVIWNARWRGDFYLSHNRLQQFKETNAGLLLKYSFEEQTALVFGLANRFGDAFILQTGIEWEGLELIISYDFGHQSITGAKGIFELGLAYCFKKRTIADPRFNR
jgi:type IX secretion system PorP/SprF family membrane protein